MKKKAESHSPEVGCRAVFAAESWPELDERQQLRPPAAFSRALKTGC